MTMIVGFSSLPFVAFAQTNFVRDLFIGISGSDVLNLQQILNKDPETKISDSGVGSFGNETDYFGSLTKMAVQKFQLKYSDYVLKPIGLTTPTGYVGLYTREFLNKTFSNIDNFATSTQSNVKKIEKTEIENTSLKATTTDSFIKTYSLIISSLSQENPTPGEVLELNGFGFSETDQVYINTNNTDIKIENIEYVNGSLIKIKIPKVKEGIYFIYATGLNGDTRWILPLFIFISDSKINSKSTNKKYLDSLQKMKELNKQRTDQMKGASNTVSIKDNFSNFLSSTANTFKGFFYNEAMAQVLQKTYWGGHISEVVYCPCVSNFGIVLSIKEINNNLGEDLKVVYKPIQSTLRAKYNIEKAGADTIGGLNPDSFTCEIQVYTVCVTNPQEPNIINNKIDFLRGVGTSPGNSANYKFGI